MTEALIGLGGVIIGAMIAPSIDWYQRYFERRSRARYLAIRTVIALDRYVTDCAEVMEEDPIPNDEPDTSFNPPAPPDLPSDVDWSAIDADLAYRVLSLPNQHAAAEKAVFFMLRVTDSWGAHDERDERFVELGLAANKLADEFRVRFKLDARKTLNWDPFDQLKQKKAEIERPVKAATTTEIKEFLDGGS